MNYGIELGKGIWSYNHEWKKTPRDVPTIGTFQAKEFWTNENGFPIVDRRDFDPVDDYENCPPKDTQINYRKVLAQCGLNHLPVEERERILSGIEETNKDQRKAHSCWSTAMEMLKSHNWILPMVRDEILLYEQGMRVGVLEVPSKAHFPSDSRVRLDEKLTLFAMDADYWEKTYIRLHGEFQRMMQHINHHKYSMPKYEKLFLQNGGRTLREQVFMDKNVAIAKSIFFYLSALLNNEYPRIVRLKEEVWAKNFGIFGKELSYLLKVNLSIPDFADNNSDWQINEMKMNHCIGHYSGYQTDVAFWFDRKYELTFAQEVGVRFCLYHLANEQDDDSDSVQVWTFKNKCGRLSQRWKCKWYLEETAAGPYGWQLVGDKYYKVVSSFSLNGNFLDQFPHSVYPAYELQYTHAYGGGGRYKDYLGPILEHTLTCARYYLPRDKLNMTYLTERKQQFKRVRQAPVWNMLPYKDNEKIPSEWYTKEIAITRIMLQGQMNPALILKGLMRTRGHTFPSNESGELFVSNFALALKDARYNTVDPIKIRFYAQIWDFLFNSQIIETWEFIPRRIQTYMRQFGIPFNLEDPTDIAI